MGDVTGLVERLEKATGGDRGLDALLAQVAGWEWHGDGPVEEYPLWAGHWVQPGFPMNGTFGIRGKGLCDCNVIDETHGNDKPPPAYTASLDAALALVERVLPGWSYGITSPDNPEDDPALQRQHFSARLRKSVQIIRAHAPTPALALCLAALKALAQGNEGSPPRNSGVDGESDVPANSDENAPE